jgi:hypothetical protein
VNTRVSLWSARRQGSALVLGAVWFVAGVGAGCGPTADVRIAGGLDGRALRATGTVAAWVDRSGFVRDPDGALVLVDRTVGDTWLHVRFFETVFDPSVSFDRLPSAERVALEEELARGDQITVAVARGAALRAGDAITADGNEGTPEVLPYIDSVVVALRDGNRGAASYPESLADAIVDDKSAALDVEAVSPRIAGALRFRVTPAGVDGSAGGDEDRGSEIAVDFSAALLPERVAECNFERGGAGAVDACTLAPSTP